MIVGTGIDIVEVDRIEKLLQQHPERFLAKLFTSGEISYAQGQKHTAQAIAHRFAAKEALVKALGIGFQEEIRFHDIEVIKSPLGQPQIVLTGKAKQLLEQLIAPETVYQIHCSLSHTASHAVALVIIEKASA